MVTIGSRRIYGYYNKYSNIMSYPVLSYPILTYPRTLTQLSQASGSSSLSQTRNSHDCVRFVTHAGSSKLQGVD
jgi:hypothetical protein